MKKITLLLMMCFISVSLFAQTFTGATGPITDNNCDSTHDFPVTVSGIGVLGTANSFSSLGFSITHTWDSDLDIYLVAPDGITIVDLSTDNGGSGDNYTSTVISAEGSTAITAGTAPFTGTYTPEGNLALLNGLSGDGTWILRVCDDASGDVGTVNSWSITFSPVILDLPDYVNLQFPYTATIAQGGSVTVYGQVYEGGLTDTTSGQAPGIMAWVGISPVGSNTNPNTWTNWIPTTFNVEDGNNDEYQATIGATLLPGTYYYATRFRLNGGAYVYGGTNFGFWNGTDKISGVLTVNPPPAPANDDCSGALPLTVNQNYLCGSVTAGTVVGATASTQDSAACGGTEDDDVWFSFVATSTAHRISVLNVVGSATDMYHSLWTGADCTSLALVPASCSDANVSNPTALTIGQTYYVRVYTFTATGNQNTTFNVCIGTQPPPPTNDNFATPIPVSCGNIYTGDTSSPVTLDEDTAPDGFGADMDSPNLWYSFTGSGSAQTVTLNLCGSAYDSSVLVYTGTSGNLTLVAGNDDDGTCVSNTANSKVIFTSDGTTTYYIAVEGYNVGSVGAFTMNVTCAAVIPPAVANQDCGTSLPVLVNGLDNNSDNSFGTVSSAQPTCDLFGSIQDVWFSFEAPASGLVTCQVTPTTMTSANFTIYSGTCGALTQLTGACNANLTVATSESLTGLMAGTTYYVQVWSNSSEQGTFVLRLSDDGLGNEGFDNSNFSYYPNPVKNSLNLSYNQEISTVEVFNLLGQKVSSNAINANTAQIEMSNLSKGAYIVRVTSDNQVKTIKVIKE